MKKVELVVFKLKEEIYKKLVKKDSKVLLMVRYGHQEHEVLKMKFNKIDHQTTYLPDMYCLNAYPVTTYFIDETGKFLFEGMEIDGTPIDYEYVDILTSDWHVPVEVPCTLRGFAKHLFDRAEESVSAVLADIYRVERAALEKDDPDIKCLEMFYELMCFVHSMPYTEVTANITTNFKQVGARLLNVNRNSLYEPFAPAMDKYVAIAKEMAHCRVSIKDFEGKVREFTFPKFDTLGVRRSKEFTFKEDFSWLEDSEKKLPILSSRDLIDFFMLIEDTKTDKEERLKNRVNMPKNRSTVFANHDSSVNAPGLFSYVADHLNIDIMNMNLVNPGIVFNPETNTAELIDTARLGMASLTIKTVRELYDQVMLICEQYPVMADKPFYANIAGNKYYFTESGFDIKTNYHIGDYSMSRTFMIKAGGRAA